MDRDIVLVIDDDPDYREMVSVFLHGDGLTCVDAEDCATALAVLDRHRRRMRAVLLDYFMPAFNPRACAKEIVARVDPSVAVVLVSAAVRIGDRAAEVGLRRYLSKPFDMDQLRAAVLGAA